MAVLSCYFLYADLVHIQKDLSNQTRLNVIHTYFPFNKHLLNGLCYNISLLSMMQFLRLLQISWPNQVVLVFNSERLASIIPFISPKLKQAETFAKPFADQPNDPPIGPRVLDVTDSYILTNILTSIH